MYGFSNNESLCIVFFDGAGKENLMTMFWCQVTCDLTLRRTTFLLRVAVTVPNMKIMEYANIVAVLQIRGGRRDNLGIIFHVTCLKHML